MWDSFKSFLGRAALSPGALRARSSNWRVRCRKDLNYPHTAVVGDSRSSNQSLCRRKDLNYPTLPCGEFAIRLSKRLEHSYPAFEPIGAARYQTLSNGSFTQAARSPYS